MTAYITAMKSGRDKTRQGTERSLHVKFPHHSRVNVRRNQKRTQAVNFTSLQRESSHLDPSATFLGLCLIK